MHYYFYRKLATREILRGEGNLEDAKIHLSRDKHGFVQDEDGNIYRTIEELDNVENIRPKDTAGYDKFFSSRAEIPEDTDRELFEFDSDQSESSSERDN